jgi:hypothetical protein
MSSGKDDESGVNFGSPASSIRASQYTAASGYFVTTMNAEMMV